MEKLKARDLMIPKSEFPKISERASIYEGLAALEKTQKSFQAGGGGQRILLVEDREGKILGKLSPIDLLRGLETNYNQVDAEKVLSGFGLQYMWESLQQDYHLWENSFRDLCAKAQEIRLQSFVRRPPDGQSVDAGDPMAKCLHRFVINRHDALFVLQSHEIVGLLRFQDVYQRAAETMKECRLEADR